MTDPDGKLYLSEREPYGYVDLPDTIEHTAIDGDTWWSIAGKYYAGQFLRPSELYWVIMDFQPEASIQIDPTVALEAGTVIYVPHPLDVREKILSEERRQSVEE